MRTTDWVAAALAAAVAAGCASRTAATAPAAPAATDVVGRFVWHDLVTRDAAACQRFYGELLGWEFTRTTRNGRPYVVAHLGGDFVGGFVQRPDMGDRPAVWLAYLAIVDLEKTLAEVKSAGGQVLLQPTRVGAYGRVAVVRDPQGAPLGLAAVTAMLRDEPIDPPLKRFFWMEYLAKDAATALVFYKDLGGYESTVTVTERGFDYNVLRRQRSRAGLLQIPPQLENVEPNWLPYVRVENPAALAAKVPSLGGRVVLEPRADVRRGTLAIVTDPTGGAIALQKWPI
jgi:predicted enzyme related to lactoylglutathione lyase